MIYNSRNHRAYHGNLSDRTVMKLTSFSICGHAPHKVFTTSRPVSLHKTVEMYQKSIGSYIILQHGCYWKALRNHRYTSLAVGSFNGLFICVKSLRMIVRVMSTLNEMSQVPILISRLSGSPPSISLSNLQHACPRQLTLQICL